MEDRQNDSLVAGQGLHRGGAVEALIFGTRDGDAVEEHIRRFCREQLGAEVSDVVFRATSVGVVFGVRLSDGLRAVVKVHQPRESRETLEALHAVQSALFRADFPCPEPFVGPTPLGRGLAVIESLLDEGEFRDTHEPTLRRSIAEALARHLELTRECGRPASLGGGWSLYASGGLWPRDAHAPIFDFKATAAGAEWIDAIAARAKPLAAAPGEVLVGHSDWSGKHFRFAEQRITAIYDWDSVRLGREAVIVGNAAMTFTTNFDMPGLKLTPTPDEVRAFVNEYSAARHTPLNRSQRGHVAACATFVAAYTARCEHCGYGGYNAEADPNSFTTALREHGLNYLIP
jgi:Phosphotransferase enzyme family